MIGILILLMVALTACQQQTKQAPAVTEQPAQPSPPRQPTEAENWERTKDCAARVDSLRNDKNTEYTQSGTIAHYSRKYGRCFMQVTDTMKRKPGLGERQSDVMLMDAFEGSIGAQLPALGPCYLGGKQDDRAKAEAFIADAMAN
jgi:hypothetical protein